MKAHIRQRNGGDTLIEGILLGLDAESAYVLWRTDRAGKAQCYVYVEIGRTLYKVRASELHEDTFEDFLVECAEKNTPIPYSVISSSDPHLAKWEDGGGD